MLDYANSPGDFLAEGVMCHPMVFCVLFLFFFIEPSCSVLSEFAVGICEVVRMGGNESLY